MPKYRRLSLQELESMEKEFVHFLALHGIDGPEWVKVKASDTEQVDSLVEQFSDAVFEGILRKVEYLEVRSPQDIKAFHCEEEKISLLGLKIDGDGELNFESLKSPEALAKILQESDAKLQMYSAEKAYKDSDRNAELFRMMQAGASISKDGQMYKLLLALKTEG
jgi:hypothetical protein